MTKPPTGRFDPFDITVRPHPDGYAWEVPGRRYDYTHVTREHAAALDDLNASVTPPSGVRWLQAAERLDTPGARWLPAFGCGDFTVAALPYHIEYVVPGADGSWPSTFGRHWGWVVPLAATEQQAAVQPQPLDPTPLRELAAAEIAAKFGRTQHDIGPNLVHHARGVGASAPPRHAEVLVDNMYSIDPEDVIDWEPRR